MKKETMKDLNFIKQYVEASNAATGSKYDANANVANKNVATLAAEIHKGKNIAVNREMMYEGLKEKFGEHLANEYIRQLETHEIYKHDETSGPGVPYCVSVSMYPFLFDGLMSLGGDTKAPTNLQSFNGSYINLCFLIASQFAGALATPEYILYTDYFIRKEFGDDYHERLDEFVYKGHKEYTIKGIIEDGFQQVVYSINQPASARGFQSIFLNIAYFDKYYFQGMFEDFIFPDGTRPTWGSVSVLQKTFMKWFNKERKRNILTFPVETLSLLYKDGKYQDEEWANFAAEMLAEGHSFFIYQSDSVDSLASCCFDGDQMVLTKSSSGVKLARIEDVCNGLYKDFRRNFTVFHNGSWRKASVVRLMSDSIYEVTTMNNKKLLVTPDHIHLTLEGDKTTEELTTDDYLAFNTRPLSAYPEKDLKLSYEEGYLIGLYAGDGSKYKRKDCESYEVTLSLNKTKNTDDLKLLQEVASKLDEEKEWKYYEDKGKELLTVKILSKAVYDFVSMWVKGNYAHDKRFSMGILQQSIDFRKGIVDGWYASDGGNSNRIYTISTGLVHTGEALFTSLGINTVINKDSRINEVRFVDEQTGKEYRNNYHLYSIRWYDMKNKRSMKDIYTVKLNTEYFKIKSIEKITEESPQKVFCFSMEDENEPYFTLPNGVITHNCRLRNAVEDNTFSFSLGAGGLMTGSKSVITINFNRLVQNAYEDFKWDKKDMYLELGEGKDKQFYPYLQEFIKEQVQKIHKYHEVFNDNLKKFEKSGMLPVYDAGYIALDKQYLTIGINGVNEAAEFLGLEVNNNEEYRSFINVLLEPIYKANRAARTKELMFNTEFVPSH